MRCALKNVLLFCFLSSAIGLASAVNCAPADKDGTPLTSSQASGDFVTCVYSGAGECTYFPSDGSFSSGSSQCPKGLPQGPGGGGSNPTTTQAPPPPATTQPPPPPPVTTSTTHLPPVTTPSPPPLVTSTTSVVTTSQPATSSTPTTLFTTVTNPTTSATSTVAAPSSPPSNAALPSAFVGNGALAVMGLLGVVAGINLL